MLHRIAVSPRRSPTDLNEVRVRVLHGAVTGLRHWALVQAARSRSAPPREDGAAAIPEWGRVFGAVDGMLAHAIADASDAPDAYARYRRMLGDLFAAAQECRRHSGTSSGLESHAWRLAAQELWRTAQHANRAPRWLRDRSG